MKTALLAIDAARHTCRRYVGTGTGLRMTHGFLIEREITRELIEGMRTYPDGVPVHDEEPEAA